MEQTIERYSYSGVELSPQAEKMRDLVAEYIAIVSRKLPSDVADKLVELSQVEVDPMQTLIYNVMRENQMLAEKLERPSCQDTGALQFFVRVGLDFPLLGELNKILKDAVYKATKEAPLRHNAVETFDEYNTGLNIGHGLPTIFTDLAEGDQCDIYVYMAGGGCSLPGQATVLMPGEGYEGVVRFVMDRMTSYGLNACPPLYVGVGIGTAVEVAAMNSKLALMRPVGSVSPNERAAKLESLLEEGINNIGLGPQGVSGRASVMGVSVVNTGRHPSVIAVAVNVGCWSHRRGLVTFNPDLSYELPFHEGVEL